jgi:hypothetical protein
MHNLLIKRDGIEKRKRSTGLLHVLAGFFLLLNAIAYYKEIGYGKLIAVLPAFLVALISLTYGVFRNRLDPAAHYNHWIRMLQFLVFALLGIYMLKAKMDWTTFSLFLWAVVCIPLLFTERKIFHDASLNFTQNNIMIPGYFSSKTVPWSAISDIVIRPDYVTIYYPGNKFVQYEVLDDVPAVELEKMNQFCQQKLMKASA